jgi:hypothetical protein
MGEFTPVTVSIEHLESAVSDLDDLVAKLEARIGALEDKAAPVPTSATVTISKAAFDEALKVMKLILRNPDDEPQATTNRMIHAIGVLTGDIPPLPF